MNDEKDDFCNGTYYTLQDARNKLYTLLTEILTEEAGYLIDHTIQVSKLEKDEIKKVMGQIDHHTSFVSAIKASRNMLIEESEVVKKELTEAAQEELNGESTGDENKDEIRYDTAYRLLHYMKEEK